MKYLSSIVTRLNGRDIEERFDQYLGLVRDGIAGFIVFGGRLESVREGIKRLQAEADIPLIISSDLEQGLGQQLEGGTLFPPAQAVAEAANRNGALEQRVFNHMAREAAYAGINVVFAPVLDIDSNPKNPIIATRSFGHSVEVVSSIGASMIQALERNSIRSCGKHFPGHGDTSVDSHIGLPRLDATIERLREFELKPFEAGIKAGASMMMLAHMSVPAIDSVPVSVSGKAVKLLRDEMCFSGIITTDAMDMGALKAIGEEKAALMALEAGVDILLHPTDPRGLANALERMHAPLDTTRLARFRMGLIAKPASEKPFNGDALAKETALMAVRIENGQLPMLKNPIVAVISDEGGKGEVFAKALGARLVIIGQGSKAQIPEGDLVLAVFSSIRAYKGGAAGWMSDAVRELEQRASIAVAFGPSVLVEEAHCVRVHAWWGTGLAEKTAAEALIIA